MQFEAILETKYILKRCLFHEYARLGLIFAADAWASKCRLTKKGCQQHQKYLCVCPIQGFSPTSCFWLFFIELQPHARELSFTVFKSATCTRKRGSFLPLPDAETPASGADELT